jgi:undecaprenyl-diphosphatase
MTAVAAFQEVILGTGPKQWGLWLSAFVAALALTGLALLGVYPPGDVTLTRVVQAVQLPGLDLISEFVYRIGLSPVFQIIALATAVLMALRKQRLMALFMVLTLIVRGSGVLLKELVERPRPSPALVDVTEQANGFSFPSGHVLGAVLLWGFIYFASERLIANERTRRWVRWSSLAVIVLMGLQRVYAGAHWPSDVLAAYLWGGVILFIVIKAFQFCGLCHFQSWISRLRNPLRA